MDWNLRVLWYLLTAFLLTGRALSQSLTLMPSRVDVVKYVNNSYFVSCQAEDAVRVTWYKPNGEAITNEKGRIHVENARDGKGINLMFEVIEKKDRGNYSCKAQISGQDVERSFNLVVIKPIVFVDTPQVQYADEGSSDFLVKCEVEGEPEPRVTWTAKGKSPKGDKYTVLGDGLSINNVTLADAGDYLCKAIQASSQASSTESKLIHLIVNHKPVWAEDHPERAYSYISGSVNLTCKATAQPYAVFQWIKDNETVEPHEFASVHSETNSSVLQLVVHNASVFGDYICRAENDLGTLERVIVLQEGARPDPPEFEVQPSGTDGLLFYIHNSRRNALDVTGYRVQYKMLSQDWHLAEEREFSKGTPYVLAGLSHDTEYSVRVAARNAVGVGEYSAEKKQKTPTIQAGHVSTVGSASLHELVGGVLILFITLTRIL